MPKLTNSSYDAETGFILFSEWGAIKKKEKENLVTIYFINIDHLNLVSTPV
jgi:hypothetical protein